MADTVDVDSWFSGLRFRDQFPFVPDEGWLFCSAFVGCTSDDKLERVCVCWSEVESVTEGLHKEDVAEIKHAIQQIQELPIQVEQS